MSLARSTTSLSDPLRTAQSELKASRARYLPAQTNARKDFCPVGGEDE